MEENTLSPLHGLKHPANGKDGLLLIPKPSESPQDPLNWSPRRKSKVLAVLCLAAYTGNVAAVSGQLAYPIQAETYGVTILESSYSVSAAIAGLAAGAILLVPLASIVGRWSITFWSLLGSLICAIWSARMTASDDYIPFILSRMFSGLFGSVPSAVGGSIILDIFFLHNRGKAFICYALAIILGATSGPTFSGYITDSVSWTFCFWWTVPLIAISAALVFIVAEETAFDRETCMVPVATPRGFWPSRIAILLPGNAVVPTWSPRSIAEAFAAPWVIGLSPVAALCGLFTMIVFGWLLLNDILSPTFLQTPVSDGGYGFTPSQNASFSFSNWVAAFISQSIGLLVNDRVPLWICKTYYGGIWKPELRLYVMALTVIFTPVGLGICGVALQQHYRYMVFAVGNTIVSASVLFAVPVATNYVAESFTSHGSEATMAMTAYRLSWGVAIPFLAAEWIMAVEINWVYGMAAFFTIGSSSMILMLIWKGSSLRKISLIKRLQKSEEGERVF